MSDSRLFRLVIAGLLMWFLGLPLLGLGLFFSWSAAAVFLPLGLAVSGFAVWLAFSKVPRESGAVAGGFCPFCGRRRMPDGSCVVACRRQREG